MTIRELQRKLLELDLQYGPNQSVVLGHAHYKLNDVSVNRETNNVCLIGGTSAGHESFTAYLNEIENAIGRASSDLDDALSALDNIESLYT